MNQMNESVPVVGIGASAGGIKALEVFFKNTSPDSGLAYIVIVHLAKGKKSMLPELLEKWSDMPVKSIKDQIDIRPNCIYVSPPEQSVTLTDKHLRMHESPKDKVSHHPIDVFFRSLAFHRKNRSACVILSGTGTDGTLGVKEINANNGFVVVQSPESAEYEGMPRSAIKTGFADYVLTPQEMPQSLSRFFSGYIEKTPSFSEEKISNWISRLFSILKEKSGHDFSLYKKSTLLRRIHRRMAVNQIDDYKEYLELLQSSDEETESLFSELLIGVTSFFRDAESFEVLKEKILPESNVLWGESDTFRGWIPGCSTGEEAYSLAIVLDEFFQEQKKSLKIQLFGSDIDKNAIETARHGIYPQTIENDVSLLRLKRYFFKDGNYYKVKPNIRENIIFSVQDILREPPFSGMHLICCRNLLIYLNNQAQKKTIPLFHFSLRNRGLLMLGSSETIGQNDELFEALDSKWKIYLKRSVSEGIRPDLQIPIISGKGRYGHTYPIPAREKEGKDTHEFKPAVSHFLLTEITPPTLIVDENENITYIHGNMNRFLSHPTGVPSRKLSDLIRESVRFEVVSSYNRAKKNKQDPAKKNIYLNIDGKEESYTVKVQAVQGHEELGKSYAISFIPGHKMKELQEIVKEEKSGQECIRRIQDLKNELQEAKENYQAVVEEFETTTEDAKAANEELQSANEELQSTNEELESSKEELQSLNEELTTVNNELQSKVEELTEKEDDLKNLLQSSPIATVFLDGDLKIKRFTPSAKDIYNVVPSDTGRSFFDISSNLEENASREELEDVQSGLKPITKEVNDKEGRWYNMKVTPYKTGENVINGVIINLLDITSQKESQQKMEELNEELHASLDLSEGIVNSIPESILILDSALKIQEANHSFYTTFNVSKKGTIGKKIYNLGNKQWDIPKLRKLLEEVIPKKQSIENYVVKHKFLKIGEKSMVLNARKLEYEKMEMERIVLIIREQKNEPGK